MDITLIISFLGTAIGTFGGIFYSNKLTSYRIEQLEKKVEQHNNVVTRTFVLEQQLSLVDEKIKVANNRIGDLENPK